jgi:hypothetical protein
LLVAGLLVGWAAQMVYVAFKSGKLVERVDALTKDLNGLGVKAEQHARYHEQEALAERHSRRG